MRKTRSATLEKHFLVVADAGFEGINDDIELTVNAHYSFWPDSYGVRGSEFTNGECEGYEVIVDDECLKFMDQMIHQPELHSHVIKWLEDKMHGEDWMSEAEKLAFEDCYEDYDWRYDR